MNRSLSSPRLALSRLSWLKSSALHLAKTVESALRSSVCVQVHLAVPFVNPVSRSSFLSLFSNLFYEFANKVILIFAPNRTGPRQ